MSQNYISELNKINRRSDYFLENMTLNHRLVCHICSEILIDPYQTQCGCRFCYKCISEYFDNNSKLCPECHMEISVDIMKDRAVEIEILNFKVPCLNNGCNNICQFKYLNDHLEICEWRQVICDKCQDLFSYNLENKHLEELCLEKICKCNYCNEEMTRMQYQTIHINPHNADCSELCENLIVECPYNCNIEISDNIKTHLAKCPNKSKKCVLFHFGCEFLGNLDDMTIHVEQNSSFHLLLMSNEINKLNEENTVHKELLKSGESHIQTIESLKQENAILEKQLKILEVSLNENHKEMENMKFEIKNFIGIEEEICRDLCLINGVCIWTIRNIQQKIKDAKLGVNVQITSKPFYLHEPGYRFALRIYPDGHGQGKGNFLSIYFMIFKGEFDNQINWPFKNQISLSLISNDRSVQDSSLSMKPDNNITFYGQPINEFNLATGLPEFVNLTELLDGNSFVQDGSIRIRFEMKSKCDISRSGNVVQRLFRKRK